jgi:hypothetical protein
MLGCSVASANTTDFRPISLCVNTMLHSIKMAECSVSLSHSARLTKWLPAKTEAVIQFNMAVGGSCTPRDIRTNKTDKCTQQFGVVKHSPHENKRLLCGRQQEHWWQSNGQDNATLHSLGTNARLSGRSRARRQAGYLHRLGPLSSAASLWILGAGTALKPQVHLNNN